MKAAALEATRRGWSVFPCGTPRGGRHGHEPGSNGDCTRCDAEKAPRYGWPWKERNSSNPEVIEAYWPEGANVGIACGASRLVVIDLDKPKRPVELPERWRLPGIVDGLDVFAHVLEQHSATWPVTFSTRTPRGGAHLYFDMGDHIVRNGQGRIGTFKTPMIDVRAGWNADGLRGGGYVLAAGSVVGGVRYEVTDDSDPAPLPAWLAEMLTKRPEPRPMGRPVTQANLGKRLSGLVNLVLTAPPQQGNGCLFWASCRVGELVLSGELDEGTAERVLLDAAVQRGRPEGEARRTILSGMGRVR